MKAQELMIGDWVMQFGEPRRIVGIRTDAFYPYIKTNMGDTWYEEGMKDLAEPILLTPEILEKNGFLKHSHLSTDRYELIVGESRVNYWVSKKILDIRGGNHHGDFFDEKIYVHELQHALRLCGIEKEIEL